MKKRIVLALVLGAVLSLTLGSITALAHTHVDNENGTCTNIPGNGYVWDPDADDGNGAWVDNSGNEAENSHFGVGVAKGSTFTPQPWAPVFGAPGNSPLTDYPGGADAPPLDGGLCD
jgi:hypothetical protein